MKIILILMGIVIALLGLLLILLTNDWIGLVIGSVPTIVGASILAEGLFGNGNEK